MFWKCLLLQVIVKVCAEEEKHEHHLPHKAVEQRDEHWIESFSWNVLGYALVILPAMFLVRMVRKSNFYEKEGEGCVFRLVKCFVFGIPGENKASASVFSKLPCLQSTDAVKLVFCTLGLQVCYLTWGVLQEKVMVHSYGDTNLEKFHNSEFLVFMNRITAFAVAGVYILMTGGNWQGPFYEFSFSSLSNICSSWCQYEALRFVTFPTQVLGKTSKMIPVMLMGRFVMKKTYHYYEYVVAAMISFGVSMFLLSTSGDKHSSSETTFSGLVLMVGYMGFDSFTSNWQSRLFRQHEVSSMQMMFNVNCFSAILTFVPLFISGGMRYSLAFVARHSQFGVHASIISLTSAAGQLFIFYTIAEFGPLVFTTIMVTRQMLSILLSCLIYGHFITAQAGVGVMIVFVALFLQIYSKYRIKQRQLNAEDRPRDMV